MNWLYTMLSIAEPKRVLNILLYHGFMKSGQTCGGIENYHGKHLEINKFQQQITYLCKHYTILPLREVLAIFLKKKPMPAKGIVLTMDDGYCSNYQLAFPVLKQYAVPATIFLATDFIDKKDYLWIDRIEYAIGQTSREEIRICLESKDTRFNLRTRNEKIKADRTIKTCLKKLPLRQREEIIQKLEKDLDAKLVFQSVVNDMYQPLEWNHIREMSQSGLITFASHTSSHTIMTSILTQEMAQEVRHSQQRIHDEIGVELPCFGYPNGDITSFNPETKACLKSFGYQGALTTIIGGNDINTDIFELKRLNIHNEGDLRGFIITLSSVGRFLRKMKYEGLS